MREIAEKADPITRKRLCQTWQIDMIATASSGRPSPPQTDAIKHSASVMFRPTAMYFGCPNCSAVYQALQQASTRQEVGMFSCRSCGLAVHSWRGGFAYTDWRLIDPETGGLQGGSRTREITRRMLCLRAV